MVLLNASYRSRGGLNMSILAGGEVYDILGSPKEQICCHTITNLIYLQNAAKGSRVDIQTVYSKLRTYVMKKDAQDTRGNLAR